jgi:hypothetical protein
MQSTATTVAAARRRECFKLNPFRAESSDGANRKKSGYEVEKLEQ